MRIKPWIDPAFALELVLLAAAAPALYFPDWFPAWAPYAMLGVLALGWGWRRWRLGVWLEPTPADWPIFFLFVVMLPVAIWAAPAPLRQEYSIPRAHILLWNFCLFWAIVTHASRSRHSLEWALGGFALLALIIALGASLGMNWLYKFPQAEMALSLIPAPLVGVFAGAESGFHPNQVALTLLNAFPLMLAITGADALRRRSTLGSRPVSWLIWVSTPMIGLILLLTQSRSAFLGLSAGVTTMFLVNWRWGRLLLFSAIVLFLAGLPMYAPFVLTALGHATPEHAPDILTDTRTLAFRLEVWSQAMDYLRGFPFTGIGLGTFRRLMWMLGPTGIDYTVDIGHAHNFFLQSALDFGVPGLIAIVAVYLAAIVQIVMLWRATRVQNGVCNTLRFWAIGFIGSLVAQLIAGSLDAVAMGAKTNLAFWWLLALIFAAANNVNYSLSAATESSVDAADARQREELIGLRLG